MIKISCSAINFTKLFTTHPLETLSVQNILKNKSKLICYTDDPKDPGGILIQSGYLHYAYAKETTFIEDLLKHFNQPGAYGFAGIPREITSVLQDHFQVEWSNPCTAYTLSQKDYHPERQIYKTRPLRLQDAELVNHHYPYRGDHSLKMIRKDIALRPSSAIFINDQPVAWALQHPDGTIGMMHTLEEHRSKGYARDTTLGIIQLLIQRDETPIVQISDTNMASQALAKSCGFKSFGTADWFGIMVK